MPKARGRRKGAGTRSAQSSKCVNAQVETTQMRPVRQSRRSGGQQGLLMAGMVALGCWGLAVSFAFFTTDSNRYLFGGMAALMGLMWSFMFAMRLRRMSQQK